MALQYVGGTSATGTSTGYTVSLSGTLTGGIASSPAAGDIIVVASGFGNTASSAPAISGNNSGAYTGLGAALHVNDTWDTEFRMFYAVQGSTPDTTLTVTRTTNAAYGGATVVQVWRGVNTASPIDVTGTPASTTNGSRGNPPSVTPVTSGAVVIAGGAGTQGTAGSAFTVPSGMGNAVSTHSNGTTSDIGVWIASAAWTSGAYDPPAWTGGATSTSSSAAAQTIALKPFVAVTHDATGDIPGLSAAISGVVERIAAPATHATTGALTGQIGSVVGSSAHSALHATSGALTGQIGTVAGTAVHNALHATSGALSGQGSTLAGASTRFRTFTATGALVAQGAGIAGGATRFRAFTSTGALTGQGSSVSGVAARTLVHTSSGALTGPGASIVGAADHTAAGATHSASGALSGQGSTIAGTAAHTAVTTHATSGALAGQGAILEAHARHGATPTLSRGRGFKPLMQSLAA